MDENFLQGYCRLNTGTEIPPIFARWCGIAAVSCALGRKVYVQFGMKSIYPNFYIVLVATSALQRKSTAINIARNLVSDLQPPPKIVAQKVTPQALIQAIRHVEMDNLTEFGRESGTGYAMVDELNVFLNKQSYEAGLASLMIKMYDCDPYVDYQTVGRGVEAVKDSCLGMLSGSTVEWLRSGITEDAVGGGLTSRMIFVWSEDRVPDVPWPEYNLEAMELRDKLRRQLQEIATYGAGGGAREVRFTPDAKEIFIKEYSRFRHDPVKGRPAFFSDKNLSGYGGRRGDHLIKVCIVLAACEGSDLMVQARHVEAAIMCLEELEDRLPRVLSIITSTQVGTEISQVRSFIKQRIDVQKSELQSAFSHKFKARELSELIDTLVQSGEIIMTDTLYANKVVYHWCKNGD